MKTLVATLLIAFGSVALGDEFDDRAAYAREQAVKFYPATKDPRSALVKKMKEIDAVWEKSKDQRFYSPEKPYLLAARAAKALGIKPVPAAETRAEIEEDDAAQHAREKRELAEQEHRLRKLEKAERDRKNRDRESGTFKE